MARFTGLLGLITFLGLAYAFSTNRRAIRWRTVAWGLGLQVIFAFLVIKWSFGQVILHNASSVITSLLALSDATAAVLLAQGLGDVLTTQANGAAQPLSLALAALLAAAYFAARARRSGWGAAPIWAATNIPSPTSRRFRGPAITTTWA